MSSLVDHRGKRVLTWYDGRCEECIVGEQLSPSGGYIRVNFVNRVDDEVQGWAPVDNPVVDVLDK